MDGKEGNLDGEEEKALRSLEDVKAIRTVDDVKGMRTTDQTVDDGGPTKTRDDGEMLPPVTKRQAKLNKSKANEHKIGICMEFVKNTLNRGVKNIIAEFRGERRINNFTKMKAFQEFNKEGRNRYKDVGCLDETRVKLALGPVPYIHANYVSGYNNPKRFICTQAPLDKTIADFWYMIVQEASPIIIMLCNHKEQNCRKCSDYFPMTITNALVVNDDIVVTVSKIEQLKIPKHLTKSPSSNKNRVEAKPTLIMRSHLTVQIKGHDDHKVTHLHWKDWPDRGVPAIDYAPIGLCERLRKNGKLPVTIHCSAGVGRTGCIVLINLLYELHMAGVPWDTTLVKYLVALRSQRNNSVQTEQQYLYVHAVILGYVFSYLGQEETMRAYCAQMKMKKPEQKTDVEKKKEAEYLDILTKYKVFSDEYNKGCTGFG